MEVKEWLNIVAYIDESKNQDDDGLIYYSRHDDSYITRVGMEDVVKFLADREITEELTNGVGFSPKDGKWYGWSHRAIYGFEIGSTCQKGDCHYKGSSLKEQEEDAIRFWRDEYHKNVRCAGIHEENGDRYFDIQWDYTGDVPNENLKNTIGGCLHHIKSTGKGEWVAETMEDAKQMAIDFNEGVS
jgi:hypothetical protein